VAANAHVPAPTRAPERSNVTQFLSEADLIPPDAPPPLPPAVPGNTGKMPPAIPGGSGKVEAHPATTTEAPEAKMDHVDSKDEVT
jgi:hypothetical protein